MSDKPLCIDLYCGLGGWAEGFLAEGYRVIGFDIERHDYGTGGYPGELILQDVRTLHGSQFKDAAVIVASPPCQEYSYMAMPWSLAKEKARKYESGELNVEDLTALFRACFRIQREASEAAGRYIPLVVENVKGAQKWVGQAAWHFGSYYLWGDVPALMPTVIACSKFPAGNCSNDVWSERPITRLAGQVIAEHQKTVNHLNIRDGHAHTRHLTNQAEHLKVPGIRLSEVGFNVAAAQRYREGIKQAGISGVRDNGKGDKWFQDGAARHGSRSNSRKAASAHIAKIPFPLAQHIARTFKPVHSEVSV